MRELHPGEVARAAGADLLREPLIEGGAPGPSRATIDSRGIGTDDLFVGLPGEHADGGSFADQAIAAGAWGVLVAPGHAARVVAALDADPSPPPNGAVLSAADPQLALARLAQSWRRTLGCPVIAVTGSTGKTSTKDILAAMLAADRRTIASPENFNTEIGLPLAVLGAPPSTEAMVLEMAMRGPGQIDELTAIAEPDVGIITNVGPVHLENLGSLEAVAAAKAELIAGMPAGKTMVVPAGEPLLDPHRRGDLRTVTFGEGGDIRLVEADGERVKVDAAGEIVELELSLTSAHNRLNALAALAAALAVGVRPEGRIDVVLSAMRGQRLQLPWDGGAVVVVNDCYNANPMSMRAALQDLTDSATGRRVAVLGDMLELGPEEGRYHAEIGALARESGLDVLVTVGPRAAAMAEPFAGEAHVTGDAGEAAALLPELVEAGDTVLVKASRGVGLEAVAEALTSAVSADTDGEDAA